MAKLCKHCLEFHSYCGCQTKKLKKELEQYEKHFHELVAQRNEYQRVAGELRLELTRLQERTLSA